MKWVPLPVVLAAAGAAAPVSTLCTKNHTELLLHPEALNHSLCPGAPAFGPFCGAILVPGSPVKDERNPLFSEGSQAWDAYYDDGYPNVIYDPEDKKYKVWHCSYQGPGMDTHTVEGYTQTVNYRESTDGIAWPMRPLGAVPYNGSTSHEWFRAIQTPLSVSQ
jgi:hypothetical protein